ncbi:TadG family pilus assembly protein [Panacagrimonas sp.]|uniref:TadG family pilus assembly protein n=1 Tax=Panacagrimonas sp. TaxID=2480088 RepID=UPI003B52B57C
MNIHAIAKGLTPRRQRGSVLVNVAAGLSVMVVLLGSIDLGLLYYYKREYQKAADLAATAGASVLPAGCVAAELAGTESASINLAQHEHDAPTVQCGVWTATAVPRFTATADNANAIRAIILGSVPTLFVGSRNLSAEAIAVSGARSAALNLRSTLVSVDTSQSAVLNSLFGGLLGGNVSLSAVGWDGLVNTDISLLDYLDQLAIDLGVQVGDYDQLLQTDASVGELIDAAIALLDRGQGTGEVNAALGGLEVLRLAIPPGTPLIRLGDLIAVQSGTPASGLDAALQVFQLVQAFVQAANAENVAAATVNLGALSVQVKMLEPPQISAIGDPELARQDPDGPDRIYVRTAQVRTLISVNLPALGGVTGLVNAVLDLASPVTTLLNDVLSLDLVSALSGLVGSLLGIPYEVTDIQVVPGNPRIDISLDAGGGEAKVTGFNCPAPGGKELDTDVLTSVADLRVGRLETDPGAPGYVFGSDVPPSVGPVPLVDVGVKTCRKFLGLVSSCEARRPFEGGGIGIMVQSAVAGAPFTNTFIDPPNLDQDPIYETFATENIVDSLASTLGGVQIQLYGPDGGGGLGGVLNLVGTLFNTVKGILQPIINNLLSPLLDPLVNLLLETLGLDLAQLEVGARLTCGGDAALVE